MRRGISVHVGTIVVCLALTALAGCVYYNTFFNARRAFNEAEKSRKAGRFRGGRINQALYQTAIDKSLKVVENYPNSSYYDDALYVLGISYYYTEKYLSSERRLRELLANYTESKYAPECQLYLAKAKLELRDEETAVELFRSIFQSEFKRELRTEAALALGNYHFEEKKYDLAQQYFQAVRDSLGGRRDKKDAQRMIADSYYGDFRFKEALSAYLQMLGMQPDKDEKYHSLFHAGLCSFSLMRIESGLDYFNTLAGDEAYFDSLSVIRLKMAQGYEYDEDIDQAELIYQQVLDEEKKPALAAEAAYRLGLIYQFDYDDLPRAKEYYDETVKLSRSSEFGQDALQRSSDIGKIEDYARTIELDASTTQDMIDKAAETQYQLAELYWFSLNKPDSAFIEMKYVVDSFPSSVVAPKALIAMSQMQRELKGDSSAARRTLELIPRFYAHSDYVPQALQALGLSGTAADTGYAKIYLDRAEAFLADSANVDSAQYYYQYIVDNFPRSQYNLQARFSLIWLQEEYRNPGDSSLIYAYNELVDSFPNTVWANEASRRLVGEMRMTAAEEEKEDTTAAEDEPAFDEELPFRRDEDSTVTATDRLADVYVGPNGEKIVNINIEPIEIREEFEYPVEAYRTAWEGDLYFQILLDFSGEVKDFILKIRSDVDEINLEAEKAVKSMIFDPLRIPQEQQDKWLVYKFEVRKPDHLR
ncbi:MAG: tetratricopeptide repeat protein [Candidatus Zixiibacteriota bacterium]|nr:MAG: tetratricopeptide repeat protein [candidate division Zixibacteria bacterium]